MEYLKYGDLKQNITGKTPELQVKTLIVQLDNPDLFFFDEEVGSKSRQVSLEAKFGKTLAGFGIPV